MTRTVPIASSDAPSVSANPAERLARWMRPGALSLPALPPLSLYVHLPWCLRKCPYCDFNSHALQGGVDGPPETRYVDALVLDLEASLPFVWGRRVHTVFIGGGTPSLFAPASIERLIAAIRARLPIEPGCEITLEANPGTFERERFHAYAAAGVTRLSIGVQSFDDAKLAALGRVHDAAQARAAVAEAKEAFATFNLDLMYALPGQTLDALERDVDTALSFEPPHLSIYHLTVEPNTFFATHPPALPDDDTAFEMLDRIVARAAAAGLERYEVSAFARAQHRCEHNVNYWEFGDYLGIGAGAHGKISFPHRIVRETRFRDPATYVLQALAGQAVSGHEEVPRRQLPFEFMLNATRLRHGFGLARYTERTGMPLSSVRAALDEAVRRGWIEADAASVRPTARGFDFLSDLQTLFLPD